MKKTINLFMNNQPQTIEMKNKIAAFLHDEGYTLSRIYSDKADFNIVIGGDGTFLRAVRESGFSTIPFVGINTGHLGFFQEIDSENWKIYLQLLIDGQYSLDRLQLLRAKIDTLSWTYTVDVVNEFFVSANDYHLLKVVLEFDGVPIIDQYGDGIIVSTPSGSTAYNLSAKGAILYQTLEGFQLTTVSPIQSKRYDSLPSSIVVPSRSVLKLLVEDVDRDRISFLADGVIHHFRGVKSIEFTAPKQHIQRVAFTRNWYWYNLKDKFLS